MAARIQAGRRLIHHAAAELNAGRGAVTAAMAQVVDGKIGRMGHAGSIATARRHGVC